MKKVPAMEFKAKRGNVVATRQPAGDEDEKQWLKLRDRGKYSYKDPFKPAVDPFDWDVMQ